MLFIIVVVMLFVYYNRSHGAPADEVRFMLCVFTALAYVGGFIDSRLYARLDKSRAAAMPPDMAKELGEPVDEFS